jgi:hypothetical protein
MISDEERATDGLHANGDNHPSHGNAEPLSVGALRLRKGGNAYRTTVKWQSEFS